MLNSRGLKTHMVCAQNASHVTTMFPGDTLTGGVALIS